MAEDETAAPTYDLVANMELLRSYDSTTSVFMASIPGLDEGRPVQGQQRSTIPAAIRSLAEELERWATAEALAGKWDASD